MSGCPRNILGRLATKEGIVRAFCVVCLSLLPGVLCHAANLGIVKVVTLPAGAEVTIDGKRTGKAPLARRIEVGEHKVSAVLARYESASRSFTIMAGMTTTVRIELLPKPVKMTVKSNAKSGMVYVDGELVGGVNEPVMARPGVRELVVVSHGFADFIRPVRIPFSGNARITANLTKGVSLWSGLILMDEQHWRNSSDAGWRFSNGRALFSAQGPAKGPDARSISTAKAKTHWVLQADFRHQNMRLAITVWSGTGNSVFQSPQNTSDAKWHRLVVKGTGMLWEATVDGKKIRCSSGGMELPDSIGISAYPNPNNDPYFAEVRSVIFRSFNSAHEMAAALAPSRRRRK